MNASVKKTAVGFLLAAGLVFSFSFSNPFESVAQDQDLYSMSPAAFFRMEQVQQPIQFSDIDNQLLSAAIFQETNRQREKNALAMLGYVAGLEEAARMHAQNMAESNYLSHTNPDNPEQRTPWDRIRLTGLNPSYVAENIATHFGIQYEPGTNVYINDKEGRTEFRETRESPPIPEHTYQTFAKTLLEQWMASPEHRRNILAEKAESLGAACAIGDREGMPKFYCVQVFAGNAVLSQFAERN